MSRKIIQHIKIVPGTSRFNIGGNGRIVLYDVKVIFGDSIVFLKIGFIIFLPYVMNSPVLPVYKHHSRLKRLVFHLKVVNEGMTQSVPEHCHHLIIRTAAYQKAFKFSNAFIFK